MINQLFQKDASGLLVPYKGYVIPEASAEESRAARESVYCRETHDLCDNGCTSKSACKRKG